MLAPALRFRRKRGGGGIDAQQELVVLRRLLQMRTSALSGRELLVAHVASGQERGGRVEAGAQIIPSRLSVQSRATQEERKTETQHDVLPVFLGTVKMPRLTGKDHPANGRSARRASVYGTTGVHGGKVAGGLGFEPRLAESESVPFC